MKLSVSVCFLLIYFCFCLLLCCTFRCIKVFFLPSKLCLQTVRWISYFNDPTHFYKAPPSSPYAACTVSVMWITRALTSVPKQKSVFQPAFLRNVDDNPLVLPRIILTRALSFKFFKSTCSGLVILCVVDRRRSWSCHKSSQWKEKIKALNCYKRYNITGKVWFGFWRDN